MLFVKILSLLKVLNKDAIILNTNDNFFNEYSKLENNFVYQVTGFKGSNALIIVDKSHNIYFYTDGRYINEAKILFFNQTNIFVYELNNSNIKMQLKNYQEITIIKDLTKVAFFEEIKNIDCNIKLIDLDFVNHFCEINYYQQNKQFILQNSNSNSNSNLKIKENIRQFIDYYKKKSKISFDAIYIASNIVASWILNIRYQEEYTGIANCKLLILTNQDYYIIFDNNDLNELKRKDIFQNKNIIIDQNEINLFDYQTLEQEKVNFIKIENNNYKIQAIKSKKEIQYFKKAHYYEKIVFNLFLQWLYNNVNKKNIQITEYDCKIKILELRKKNKYFNSESFETIAGFASNAAIIHYKAEKEKAKIITKNDILLIDMGANYFNIATTDATRTIWIGNKINKECKQNYTLVLKCHIALASLKFPSFTTSNQLDSIARQYLWKNCKDYNHSTGHGVGSFLSVHEKPYISKNSNHTLQHGNIVSIEPGFYKDNSYGIRIENLYLVQQSKKEGWLEFKNLTQMSYDNKLINFNMLNKDEINWLIKNSNNKEEKKSYKSKISRSFK